MRAFDHRPASAYTYWRTRNDDVVVAYRVSRAGLQQTMWSILRREVITQRLDQLHYLYHIFEHCVRFHKFVKTAFAITCELSVLAATNLLHL